MPRQTISVEGDLVPLLPKRGLWRLLLDSRLRRIEEDAEEGELEAYEIEHDIVAKSFGPVGALARKTQRTSATWMLPGNWRWRAYIFEGVHHTLIAPDGKELFLGRDDGHPILPILRFPELELIADAIKDPYFELLLAPVTESADEYKDWSARFAKHLQRLFNVPRARATWLGNYIAQPDFEWAQDKKLGWISTIPTCARNPRGRFGKAFAKADGFNMLEKLFASLSG